MLIFQLGRLGQKICVASANTDWEDSTSKALYEQSFQLHRSRGRRATEMSTGEPSGSGTNVSTRDCGSPTCDELEVSTGGGADGVSVVPNAVPESVCAGIWPRRCGSWLEFGCKPSLAHAREDGPRVSVDTTDGKAGGRG